ncbi:MAG: hypothetical protein KGO05_07345, partial [Chloroflexota bacterium]|nr:hypothetical protein [Chloroflexota bacterium]
MHTAHRARLRRLAFSLLTGVGLLAMALVAGVAAAPTAHAQANHRAGYDLCPAHARLTSSQTTPPAQFAQVIHVPADYPSIQAAVNAAQA